MRKVLVLLGLVMILSSGAVYASQVSSILSKAGIISGQQLTCDCSQIRPGSVMWEKCGCAQQ